MGMAEPSAGGGITGKCGDAVGQVDERVLQGAQSSPSAEH